MKIRFNSLKRHTESLLMLKPHWETYDKLRWLLRKEKRSCCIWAFQLHSRIQRFDLGIQIILEIYIYILMHIKQELHKQLEHLRMSNTSNATKPDHYKHEWRASEYVSPQSCNAQYQTSAGVLTARFMLSFQCIRSLSHLNRSSCVSEKQPPITQTKRKTLSHCAFQ